jgi:glycosyltransferase involved in cell wall biosynthesis
MAKNLKSILFVGQAFYNSWYLSRELRNLGWEADLINIDSNVENANYYHGEDFKFNYTKAELRFRLNTFIDALARYQIFHFANKGAIYFIKDDTSLGIGPNFKKVMPLITKVFSFFTKNCSLEDVLNIMFRLRILRIGENNKPELTDIGFWFYKEVLYKWFFLTYGENWDIHLIKLAGIKIGYANNGCLDGALKTSFSQWGPINTCKDLCRYYNVPEVCSDHINTIWGKFRNWAADYQCNLGGNKVDYNNVPEVFESPWFYCLDTKVWNPDTLIPTNYLLPFSENTVKIYHSVGNFEGRSDVSNKNIKCTHIYLDLIDRYKKEGLPVEMIFFHGLPNKVIRFYQAQADIVVDMLTFGFFGANIREAMMLGKPTVCYLRPEWLKMMREEIPEYVDELPIISATPETIDEVLRELISNKAKREEIGKRSRAFVVKWHSSEKAAQYFDRFLQLVMKGDLAKEKVFQIQKEINK